MKSNITLIIQGPLLSTGMSGSGDNVSNYDCRESINCMISQAQELDIDTIISTWESEPTGFKEGYGVPMLFLQDPGLTNCIGHGRSNQYRQFYGRYLAIQYAERQYNPEYIVICRTDMILCLADFVAHITNTDKEHKAYQQASQKGFIYLPSLITWSPYSFGDFFIGGHTVDLLKFHSAQLQFARHSFSYCRPWVHSDQIFRYTSCHLLNKFDLPLYKFFPNLVPMLRVDKIRHLPYIKYHPDILLLLEQLLLNSICLFPSTLNSTVIWRGNPSSTVDQESMYYEDWVRYRQDYSQYLISCWPKLYCLKPRQAFAKQINFTPEIYANLDLGLFANLSSNLIRFTRTIISLTQFTLPREEIFIKVYLKLISLFSH